MGGIGGRLSIVREIVRFRGIESDADEEARKGVGRGGGESPVGGRARGRREGGLYMRGQRESRREGKRQEEAKGNPATQIAEPLQAK
jgi:hypothetical protein